MNLLTTHHRTRGNGPRTRRAPDAGRGMGERVAADAGRTGGRAVAVGVAVVLALTLAVAVAEAAGPVKPPRGETPPRPHAFRGIRESGAAGRIQVQNMLEHFQA